MPQKDPADHSPANKRPEAGSAPELPAAVAKQFGLHHDEATTPEEPAPPIAQEISIVDDTKTDDAVKDIVSKEGDALLAVEDARAHGDAPKVRKGFWARIGHFFAAWWHSKPARWATIMVLLAVVSAVSVIPTARYAVLNTAGVRSSASVVVLDDTTQLPLKNVTVSIGSKSVQTNREGVAAFSDLRLGPASLKIQRIAFASHKQNVTIGWGSNPLGSFDLQATGIQYTIDITDYVTGKPVDGAEAASDEVNALSDKKGKITLTVEDTDITQLTAVINARGYRSEKVTLDANTAVASKVVLVPAQKDVFVSNQSGKYDVYAIDLDGKNRKLLLAGTGNENSANSLVVNPKGDKAVLVSNRDNMRDDDGFLLQALTIIDLNKGTSVTVDHAQQIQLVDWVGDRLIYRLTLAGASASNDQRNRLVSYNFDENSRIQLATANQFNTIISAQGLVYYAASSTDEQATLGLFRVKPDGSGKKRLSQDEIWTGLRTSYFTLNLQTPDGWQSYDLKTEQMAAQGAPANITTHTFVDNEKGESLWSEQRDGQGTLLLHDMDKNSDKVIKSQDGITYPYRWLSDEIVIYRVSTNGETADYAIGKNGGVPRKITDLSPSYGYVQIY